MTCKLFSFLFSLLVLTSLHAAIPVTVRPLEGEEYSSHLEGFEEKNALLDAKIVPLAELKAILFQKEPSSVESSLAVILSESTLQTESLTFSQNQFQIQPASGGSVEPLEAGMVQMILFQKYEPGQNVDLDSDWNEIQSMELTDDQLVILRDGKLSHYFGKILEITEKAVRFEQDGDVLNVKRKHIFAVRFAAAFPKEETSGDAEKTHAENPLLGLLADTAGSSLAVSALVPVEENVQITLTSGPKLTLPVSALAGLDLTTGRAVSLATLKAESVTVTPFFGMENTPESLSKFTAPQMDRAFGGGKIRLGGKEYSAGIELCSRTQVVYRLPGAFQTFHATAGIDDSVRPGGSSEVTILADEKVLFKEVLTGKDAPKTLNLNLSGARRLTILVDFGENGNFGDYVGFGDAMLEK